MCSLFLMCWSMRSDIKMVISHIQIEYMKIILLQYIQGCLAVLLTSLTGNVRNMSPLLRMVSESTQPFGFFSEVLNS